MTDLRAVAERIIRECGYGYANSLPPGDEHGMSFIESVLREVVEEVRREFSGSQESIWKAHYKIGYSEALEQAIKVVTDYRGSGKYETGHGFMNDLDEISVKILALKDSK